MINVAQSVQKMDSPAVDAVAEAVRGLARDRSLLVKELRDTNRQWRGFDAFAKEQAAKIEATDKRIDALLANKEISIPVQRGELNGVPT